MRLRSCIPLAFSLLLLMTFVIDAYAGYSIEGYTDKRSYTTGDVIGFHVSTNSPSYSISILKEGWVDRWITTSPRLVGRLHSIPANGWIGANWPQEYSLIVSTAWQTGSYVAKFTAQDGIVSYHPFAIRTKIPGSRSRVAFLMNYNTRNAYNNWGGKSLYSPVGDQANRLSFLRPYTEIKGRGRNALNQSAVHAWLEEEGFAPEYITEEDIHKNPNLLSFYNVLILAGHHEYISRPLFDAIQNHHHRGAHIAFFSANDLYWQIRYENAGNTIVCYKSKWKNDPVLGIQDSLLTRRWRDPPLNRPGEALQGIAYQNYSYMFNPENYIVHDSTHWAFAGTNLQNGQVFGSKLAGIESDYLAVASPLVIDILLTATRNVPKLNQSPVPFTKAAAVYYEDTPAYGFPNGKGGQIFSSGAFNWGKDGLKVGKIGSDDVRKVSRNIINHMLDKSLP